MFTIFLNRHVFVMTYILWRNNNNINNNKNNNIYLDTISRACYSGKDCFIISYEKMEKSFL